MNVTKNLKYFYILEKKKCLLPMTLPLHIILLKSQHNPENNIEENPPKVLPLIYKLTVLDCKSGFEQLYSRV